MAQNSKLLIQANQWQLIWSNIKKLSKLKKFQTNYCKELYLKNIYLMSTSTKIGKLKFEEYQIMSNWFIEEYVNITQN